MEELQFTGNCLKGSRPILSFDAAFDKDPFLKVIRELLLHIFGVPQGARRSKPFIDHVLGFSVLDGKIWMRNYEVKEVEGGDDEDVEMEGTDDHQNRDEKDKNKKAKGGKKDTGISLVEIGPRVVLTPIVIQEGSFGGPIIYENKEFVSPNQVRTDLRRQKATKYNTRADQAVERAARRKNLGLDRNVAERELDELDKRKLFA
jgi:ribosome biogenesis protein BRX1